VLCAGCRRNSCIFGKSRCHAVGGGVINVSRFFGRILSMLFSTPRTSLLPVTNSLRVRLFQAGIMMSSALLPVAPQAQTAAPVPAPLPSASSPVASSVSPEQDFAQCLVRLQQTAQTQGVPARVAGDVVGKLQYVPRVIELDRRQPEFTETFANYIGQRVTERNINTGRALLAQHSALLDRLEKQYGVPGSVLVAFWGLETHYGGYLGKMSILDNLATLACDPRRSDYFTSELMAALHLVADYGLQPSQMQGSWAGAMGQTQFMPSAYRRYGVDGDGDKRIDLWNSIPDALTSAANFLQGLGWQREQRWGREVVLPNGFAYELAGAKNARSLEAWKQLGVSTAYGGALVDGNVNAALVVPAGYQGPKFLAYPNFDVIMRWNRSEYYAIAVGYLSDRLRGAPALKQMPPTDAPRLSVTTVTAIQNRLNTLGFDVGTPDGVLGPATRQAIRSYQVQQKLVADGYAGLSLLQSLGVTP